MVKINQRIWTPEALICIQGCGLDEVKVDGDSIVIGAAAIHNNILESDPVKKKIPLLHKAIGSIGSPAIRNMGTIGGNLVNASPAADSAVALLALDAKVLLVSRTGERYVALNQFFVGPGKTVMEADEVLTEVVVPSQPENEKWMWRKVGQRKGECCSVVSVAIRTAGSNGVCERARMCFGSVAPTPMASVKGRELLEGKTVNKELIDEAAAVAAEETKPIDDVRATGWYRRRAVNNIVKSSLSQMLG